jgi:hypothetical protein
MKTGKIQIQESKKDNARRGNLAGPKTIRGMKKDEDGEHTNTRMQGTLQVRIPFAGSAPFAGNSEPKKEKRAEKESREGET